jgi:Capsule assembly protein Wzi
MTRARSVQFGRKAYRLALVSVAVVLAGLRVDAAHAQALIAPGDARLRSDVELLGDARAISLPMTTWPMPLDMLSAALDESARKEPADPAVAAALKRVERFVRSRMAERSLRARASASDHPERLRTFDDSPRTAAGASLSAAMVERRWDGMLSVGLAGAARDGQALRFDGSYLQGLVGNWLVGAYAVDRWWGPGWDGSLILSSAARPIPAIALSRRTARRPRSRWLKPLGNWNAVFLVGKLEGGRADYSGPEFVGFRLTVKPASWFEFAASRTVLLCGSGAHCRLQTWINKLDGQHILTSSPTNPSLQMAGFDLRMASPWRKLPIALYGQLIGRDAIGGFPDNFLGLYGMEGWHGFASGALLRAHLEWASTSCRYYRSPPIWRCGAAGGQFFQGDRYRGFPVGDSLDQDAEATSARVDLTLAGGRVWSLFARSGVLNRTPTGDPWNTQSPVREQFREWLVSWRSGNDDQDLAVSVGALRTNQPVYGATRNSLEASLSWTHRL